MYVVDSQVYCQRVQGPSIRWPLTGLADALYPSHPPHDGTTVVRHVIHSCTVLSQSP